MKALVTGASSGIGRDIAKILSEKGYELILVARDEENLKRTANLIKTKTKIIVLDLSQKDSCQKLYEQEPQIDILVNNAGFGDCGEFSNTNLEKELQMIETNIMAYHILTKLYLKEFKKNNKGKILNVASIAGFMPGPLMSTYYATKAYVVRLSEGIREELKQEKLNVKISILCPGPVATNFNKVANVKFYLREANSMEIAKYAIKKLEKDVFYIVPGIDIKIARFLSKITPSNIISKVTYRIQKRKIQ